MPRTNRILVIVTSVGEYGRSDTAPVSGWAS